MLALGSCDSAPKRSVDLENLEFTVKEAPEWSALFNRMSGWFGGDGIFTIPLDGKRNVASGPDIKSMIIFSDTMIGEIVDGELQNSRMVNNTVAYIKGIEPDEDAITFHWAETEDQRPATLFVPDTPLSKENDYYWLGDGFMNTELDSTIYFFSYRMRNMPGEGWTFQEQETNLIALPKGSTPPFRNQRQIVTPFRFDDGGFGAGIFLNTEASGAPNPDGYIYVYGVRGQNEKNMMVARVKPADLEVFSAWRFWDGEGWNVDLDQVAIVTSNVSNELSLSALPDGRYALVFTHNGMGSPTVGLRIGATPFGPFGPVIPVYQSGEIEQENYIAYNAKAHPNLSKPGEMLISYNVNAFNFDREIRANPNLYRPRFVKIVFE